MTKPANTATFTLSLRPNQGWWVSLDINGSEEGVTHMYPFGDSTGARRFAEEKASTYQRRGYETRITGNRETLR